MNLFLAYGEVEDEDFINHIKHKGLSGKKERYKLMWMDYYLQVIATIKSGCTKVTGMHLWRKTNN